MNILFLLNHAGKGGTENYVFTLAKYLKKTDQVYFIYNEEGELVERMKSLGIEPVHMEMKSPMDFAAVKQITAFCKEKQIDLIHTQFARENYLALFVKKRLSQIKVVHTSHIIVKNSFTWKFANRLMVSKNDAIISVCNKNKDVLIENNYPTERIQVIPNGVVYKKYVHNIKNSTIRKELNIPLDEFVFVTATRFSPEKGVSYLLESIKLLTTITEKPFKVLIAGDGEEENALKEYVLEQNLGDFVLFLGYRKDMENILMGANCFINSSQNEALSFAIIEAMAKALPVIATRVGGNGDIVNEENNCGILVRYGSTVQMATAMEKMMSNEEFYQQVSANAIKTVEEKFNLEKVLEKTYQVYQRVHQGVEKND